MKTIARAVGMSAGDVVGVLNDAAAVLGPGRGEPRCWVNAGWSRSVDLGGAPRWAGLDPGAADAEEVRGLVAVLVAADSARSTKAQVAGFLLDVWCLGVKNVHAPEPMSESRLAGHRGLYFSAFEGHVQIPADLARALVFGASAYAGDLGFEPEGELAEEFKDAAVLLGEPVDPSPIGFGRDGKPFFVNGPYDDPEAVVRTLRRTVGDDGFHFEIAFPEQPSGRRRLFGPRR
ncbi:hypothetical protein [Streptomyces sp. NBC_01264]|uniref:hypothetical protein n=1 Tax=Streptomyces sp. NBC_01264 TaxID=2903804 RepID=UPI00225812B7|nr:hypothetical protein [Streptomyces sp. NBC_01264]MCX4784509.1 hypothetical protein [Streptomyces sp. NBC_01264]